MLRTPSHDAYVKIKGQHSRRVLIAIYEFIFPILPDSFFLSFFAFLSFFLSFFFFCAAARARSCGTSRSASRSPMVMRVSKTVLSGSSTAARKRLSCGQLVNDASHAAAMRARMPTRAKRHMLASAGASRAAAIAAAALASQPKKKTCSAEQY